MGIADCIREVMEATKGVLTEKEAKDLIYAYRDAVQGMSVADKFATIDAILVKAKEQMTDRATVAVLHERSTRTRQALLAQQQEAKFARVERSGVNPVLKEFHKAFLQLENIVETTRREVPWWFERQLSANEDAVIALKTPEMLNQAVDLFFQPRSSRPMSQAQGPVAALVAAFDSTTDFIYTAANKVGGYLNWRPTTIFSGRVALAERVGSMDKQAFVDRVTDLMSDEVDTLHQHGIFKHDDLAERLEKIYDLVTRGEHVDVHGQFADGTEPLVKMFYGKTINKLSDSIFDLPFKDGVAYRAYFDEFNGGSLEEVLQGSMRQIGRNLGLVRAFGPIPERGLEDMIRAAQKAAVNDAEKALIEGKFYAGRLAEDGDRWVRFGPAAKLLEAGYKAGSIARDTFLGPNPRHWFKTLSGETEIVHDRAMANFNRSIRGYVSLHKLLGTGWLTQFGDFPNTLAVMGKLSDNPFRAFEKTLHAYMGAFNPANKLNQEAVGALAASLDVLHGTTLDMYYAGDGTTANAARASIFDKGFKYTGMGRQDWVRIKAVNEYTNGRIAAALERPMADLDPAIQRFLQNAEFTEKDWTNLQTGLRNSDFTEGRAHLFPELIKDADTRFKYLRVLNDVGRVGVPRPGALEQSLIVRGTNPGTPEGEFLRHIGLFRSFGLAMATRVLPFVSENLTVRQRIGWGVSMVGAYMMRDAAKQILMGKTPKERDWSNPRTYAELLAYSGMGGVYGDLMLSDFSKFGPVGGVGGFIAGPTGSTVQTGIDWWAAMMNDEKTGGEKVQKTIQTGLRLTGADNIPIISATNNRMWLYGLYESLSPGWTQQHLGGLKSRGQSEF